MHKVLCVVISCTLMATVSCSPPKSSVESIDPASGSQLTVAPETIEVAFDRSMSAATINSETWTVTGSVSGRFGGEITPNADGTRFVFRFETLPVIGETVQVALSSSIESQSNKKLKAFNSQFTLVEEYVPPPEPFLFVDTHPAPESILARITTIQAEFSVGVNPFAGSAQSVRITGSRSGARDVELPNIFTGPTQLEIRPTRPFLPGERVTVTLTDALTSQQDVSLAPLQLQFDVANGIGDGDPSELATGSVGSSHLHVFDVDQDRREEWLAIAADGTMQLFGSNDPSTPLGTWTLVDGSQDSVVGDFDQDGHPDLVSLGTSGNRLSYLRGRGDGLGFGPPTSLVWSDAAFTRVEVSHVDPDGFPDLLLFGADPGLGVRVHFGAGTSPFARSVDHPRVDPRGNVATGDFDGDGSLDLLFVDPIGSLTTAWGSPMGQFDITTHGNPAGSVEYYTVGNFDGDDLVDVVTSNNAGLTTLWHSGAERNWARTELIAAAGRAIATDWDGDGRMDLLSPDARGRTLDIRRGIGSNGTADFSAPERIAVSAELSDLVCGDVRGNNVNEVLGLRADGSWWIGERNPTGVVDRVFVPNFSVPSDGGPSIFTVRADHEFDLDGFTMALRFDPTVLTVDSIGTADTDAGLVGVELELPRIDNENGEIIVAVIFDFLPPFEGVFLPAGTNHSILAGSARLTSIPAPASTTTLSPTNDLGSPPTDTIFVIDGQSLNPNLEEATVTVAGSVGASPAAPPVASAPFLRGDADGDGLIGLSDGTLIQSYLGGTAAAPTCLDAADANDDGQITAADAVLIYDFLFASGPPPASPYPATAVDTTPDELPDC